MSHFDLLEIDDVKPSETRELGKIDGWTPPTAPIAAPTPATFPFAQENAEAARRIAESAAKLEASRELRDDLLAVEGDSQVTGAVVYWTMSGDVNLSKLEPAWKAANLPVDWMPAPPSPKQLADYIPGFSLLEVD